MVKGNIGIVDSGPDPPFPIKSYFPFMTDEFEDDVR